MTGLLIDNFAGGGGASFALMEAFGRKVDYAINHDPEALAMHEANHPETTHLLSDVFEVDPFEVCAGRSIDAAWFSPDCTHFSRAKGGKPRSKKIRALAWVVMKWASLPASQRPRVIFLENVEEFETWGPLDDQGYPIKEREGETYTFWRKSLEKRGYVIEARKLRACDYGAPTIRKRLFMVMRCDGEPIRWPEITHKDPRKKRPPQIRVRLKPWRTAAECIDWSVPCPSIFTRKKALADNTLRRIARGIVRYVIDSPEPFIAPMRYTDLTGERASAEYAFVNPGDGRAPFIVPLTHAGDRRFHPGNEPLRTITTANGGEMALVAPHITKFRGGATGHQVDEPLATITANNFIKRPGGAVPLGLVAATIDLKAPLGTVVAGGGKHAIVCAHLNTNRNAEKPFNGADEPVHTITAGGAHINLVSAFLSQFSGTTEGKINVGHELGDPMSTIVGRGPLQALTAVHLMHQYTSNTNGGQGDPNLPAKTITTGGHHSLVASFLLKYYGTGAFASDLREPMHTATAMARFGLVVVMIKGEPYVIADIGMRMLTPRELFNAQGFSPSYVIDLKVKGRKLPKSTQIRLVGNSVSPPPAIALAVANAPVMSRLKRAGEKAVRIA